MIRLSARWELQVAVIHRPGRRDWSLPKGKADPGETLESCALREVWEETGFRCRLGARAGRTSYRDRHDREKVVDYWLMDVLSGDFRTSDEVDALRWVDLSAASDMLTYERDADLVQHAAAAVLASSS